MPDQCMQNFQIETMEIDESELQEYLTAGWEISK